ncbi:MAG: hypothetical protein GMKNLPBB_00830 [Myxococcota bacterium]|nr:hypothetical protein [Myxococcota bacterium]
MGPVSAGVDRALMKIMAPRPGQAERLSHQEKMERVARITQFFREHPHSGDPERFFPRPPPEELSPRREQILPSGVQVWDASWKSDHQPLHPDLRDSWMDRHPANRTAWARLFLRDEPRPALIILHGYMAGQWGLEQRVWPLRYFDSIGLDAVLMQLPFHARRGEPERKGPPPFPNPDPRFTIEGFRQAVRDVRVLIRWMRERGAPAVGVIGMSLGGYTTSLLATLEDGIDFAAPIIPLACIPDFLRTHNRLGPGAQGQELHDALQQAYRVISPLHRPARLPGDRLYVIGARMDRITPLRHAERLADHFNCELAVFPGSHLFHAGIRSHYRELGRRIQGWIGRPLNPRG